MLNKIIDFSLRNRLTVIVVAIVLLTAGAITLVRTEVDIFPDLNAPTVVVMTEAPGMAAEAACVISNRNRCQWIDWRTARALLIIYRLLCSLG